MDPLDALEQKYSQGVAEQDPLLDLEQKYGVEPTEPVSTDYTQMTYSEDDLTRPEFSGPIRDYMVDRYGDHMRDVSDEELIEKFTNSRRGFVGGNTLRAASEISYLNEIGDDEEKLARAGQAYEIFEGMQGIAGETTFGEKAEIVGDYARSAVLDPINVLGLGLGKVFTSVGFKGGSQIALIAAKKAYQKKIAQGVSQDVAQKSAEKVFTRMAQQATQKTQAEIAKKKAIEESSKTVLSRMTNKYALKEAGTVAAFEATVSAATDLAYQDSLVRTAIQEDYDLYQTGLSALIGGIFGGGMAMGGRAFVDPTRMAGPEAINVKPHTKNAKINLFREKEIAGSTMSPEIPEASRWFDDVQRGVELEAQDTDFFISMLLGNAKLGTKGLVHTLSEQGYVWKPRDPQDKISNWLGDIIKGADPQDAKQFIQDFTELTGIDMASKTEKLTVENFADTFKRKMSDTGKVLNATSQAAKFLGKNPNEVTLDDYVSFVSNGVVPDPDPEQAGKIVKAGERLANIFGKNVPDFQNNIIRLIVSNLSTTALNVGGYTAATSLNTATDVLNAFLTAPFHAYYRMTNPEEAAKLGLSFSQMAKNQQFKLRNTLDINTTYEQFLSYAQARPGGTKELTRVLPGGVEDLKKLSEDFDPDVSFFTLKTNQAVDVIQRANLVQAQDMYTKSIEFTTQMDKFLRRDYKMGWNEFFSQDNYRELMQTEKFAKIEAAAVEETLKSTFSKSYKGQSTLGEIATVIEDARNIPFVGLLVPFGRFFNNTMAFMADSTGFIPIAARTFGVESNRSLSEQLSRTAVAYGLVGTLAMREVEYLRQGLSWSEEIDENGAIIDEKYEFPYGALKMAARIVAHLYVDGSVPSDLLKQAGDQFVGQLTRQLGEVGQGVGGLVTALLSEDGPELSEYMFKTLGAIPAQVASGSTRFLEPVNVGVGLLRGTDYSSPDRNQYPVFADSIRYMDQIYAVVAGDVAPEKFSAASGTNRADFGKFISTTRENKLTATERVMNQLGLPSYKVSSNSKVKPAANRYNEIFHSIVESKSRALLNTKNFRTGNLEKKRLLYANLIQKAKDQTKAYMKRFAIDSNDSDLLRMMNIADKKQSTINNTMKDLGFDGKSLEDLSSEELRTLETAIKFREEYIGVKGSRSYIE